MIDPRIALALAQQKGPQSSPAMGQIVAQLGGGSWQTDPYVQANRKRQFEMGPPMFPEPQQSEFEMMSPIQRRNMLRGMDAQKPAAAPTQAPTQSGNNWQNDPYVRANRNRQFEMGPPMFPEPYQKQFEMMSPIERRNMLQRMDGGMGMDEAFQPEGYQPQDTYDDSNNRFNDAASYQVAQAGNVMNDAGVNIGAFQGEDDGVSRRRFQDTETDLRSQAARLRAIDQMLQENPDMIDQSLTFGGDMRRRWLTLKERFGAELSGDQAEYLTDATQLRQTVLRNVNRTIQEITGAQMGEQEANRIRGELPDINDSPTTFRAKLSNAMNMVRMDIARNVIYRQRGSGSPTDISDQEVTQVLSQRGAELYQQAISQGMAPAEAKLEAARRLSDEFGI